jgi:hypothetical protein
MLQEILRIYLEAEFPARVDVNPALGHGLEYRSGTGIFYRTALKTVQVSAPFPGCILSDVPQLAPKRNSEPEFRIEMHVTG